MKTDRECVECGGAIRPIKLITHGHNKVHHPLAEYADALAEQGFIIARYDTELPAEVMVRPSTVDSTPGPSSSLHLPSLRFLRAR